jgi:hypothetical protein
VLVLVHLEQHIEVHHQHNSGVGDGYTTHTHIKKTLKVASSSLVVYRTLLALPTEARILCLDSLWGIVA